MAWCPCGKREIERLLVVIGAGGDVGAGVDQGAGGFEIAILRRRMQGAHPPCWRAFALAP